MYNGGRHTFRTREHEKTMEEYSIHPTEVHHETWEEILAILRQHVALEELI
jgi:hypothetical protein